MRILLIQPPVQDFYQTGIRTYPLGLAYLAGALLENGFEVEILDAHDPARRKTIPLPAEFRYIRKYYALANKGPYRLFGQYFHFGLDLAEIAALVRRRKPDLVGITTLFSPYSGLAIDIARLIKDIDPGITTVMGGPHVWSMPGHVLQSGVVDFIIRGEAEWSLVELCRQLENGAVEDDKIASISGIGFKTGQSIYLHPDYALVKDLDSLPLPARSLLDPDRYTVEGDRYAMILTSRGCPYSCGFCALSATPCATFRTRSPNSVLAEISHCRAQYSICRFDIEDDNFTADKKHAATILKGMKNLAGPDIRLSAMNGISACNLSRELLIAMKETGFTHLDLALVTNNPEQRRAITRPGSLDEFDYILESANSKRFRTTVHIILGLPGDSLDNMMNTLLHLAAKPCLIGANIYYPVPGSTLFHAHKQGIDRQDPSFWRSTLASYQSYEGHRDEYMTLFYLSRIINYCKWMLARYHGVDNRQNLMEVIQNHFCTLVSSADRKKLEDSIIFKKNRWDADTLGAFMLQRFATRKQIEKVTIQRVKNGVRYLFTDEFCRRDIIENFLEKARTIQFAWPGTSPGGRWLAGQ